MKRRSVIILIAGLLILGGLVASWIIADRNERREWPWKQLQSAVTLGAALDAYLRKHGSYPARLDDLVTGGMLDQAAFDKLQFRVRPRGDPEPWLYHIPQEPDGIAIVGPALIDSRKDDSGTIVMARADGGGELIPNSKRDHLPAWGTKSVR